MCLAGMYEAIAETSIERVKIINVEYRFISFEISIFAEIYDNK